MKQQMIYCILESIYGLGSLTYNIQNNKKLLSSDSKMIHFLFQVVPVKHHWNPVTCLSYVKVVKISVPHDKKIQFQWQQVEIQVYWIFDWMESAGLFYTFGHWRQLKLVYRREQEGDAIFSTSWCLRNGTYKTVKMHGMSREIGYYTVKASFPSKKASLHYGNQS